MGKGIRKYINTSTIALLISVLSLTFTIWFNISRDIESRRENLQIRLKSVTNDYYVRPVRHDSNTLLIPLQYECLISNTGMCNVSVIEYKIIFKNTQIWYNDYQMYSHDSLPLSIHPGSSTALNLKIMKTLSVEPDFIESMPDSFRISLLIEEKNKYNHIMMLDSLTQEIAGVMIKTAKGNVFRSQ